MVRWVRGTGIKYQTREVIKLGEIRIERFYCSPYRDITFVC